MAGSQPGNTPPPPQVSVLMAVHDGERYLRSAVESIRAQTLREIEIVIVDDASRDGTPAILAELAAADPRIRVETLMRNGGLSRALNRGLELARAPYVARMDADDLSLPRRLAVQKQFLDLHPDIALVGSSIDWIDADGRFIRRSIRPRDSFEIRWLARFMLTVPHPSFMFRHPLPDGASVRYDPRWSLTEDHDLVCRLMETAQAACLPDVLLRYRVHPASVSRQKASEQRRQAGEICLAFQRRELPEPLVAAIEPLRACYFEEATADAARMAAAFAGARAMLAHDGALNPGRRRWLRRQTAQLVAWALRRGGASPAGIAAGFLRHAPGLIWDLGLRALETRRWLPRGLYADAPVWRNGAGDLHLAARR